LRTHCTFPHTGKPTTRPGTDADAKRIQLSRWLTDILVSHQDEAAGDYLIPGESGYTQHEMSAPAPPPTRTESELKHDAIMLLRQGFRQSEIAEKINVSYATLVEWRKEPAYQTLWDGAYNHGKFNKHKGAATAVAPPTPPAAPATKPMPRSLTVREDKKLQETVLDRLCKGEKARDLMKVIPSFNATRLADWRTNARFVTRWDEAKRVGAEYLKNGGATPAPEPVPLFQRGEDRVVDNMTFAQPDTFGYPKPAPARELGTDAQGNKIHDTGMDIVATDAKTGEEIERGPFGFTLTPEFVEGGDTPPAPEPYAGPENFEELAQLFGKKQLLAFCRIKYYQIRLRQARLGEVADTEKANWYKSKIHLLAK
jgi:hypothetical protein